MKIPCVGEISSASKPAVNSAEQCSFVMAPAISLQRELEKVSKTLI